MAPVSESILKRYDGAHDDSRFRAAWSYWNRICGDRAFPRRADFDPVEIPDLLAITELVDVLDSGRDFRFRLIGTEIDALSQGYYTHRRLSEIPETSPPGGRAQDFRACLDTGAPVLIARACPGQHNGEARTLKLLLLPLSETGREISLLWGLVLREFSDGRLGSKCNPRPTRRKEAMLNLA